jgi:hypothetical protein
MLWHAKIGSIQNHPGQHCVVTSRIEFPDDLVKETALFPESKPLYIFKDEICCLQSCNDADKIPHKTVSGIVERSVSYEGESLAGGATEHDIYGSRPNASSFSDLSC